MTAVKDRVRAARIQAGPDALMPPEGNPRFPALDGLRAFAALAVVVFHAGQFTVTADAFGGWAVSHFDSGVTIFFVLTGFLLYRPFLAAARDQAPSIPMRRFYWRRILRIVPAYWAALLVLAPLLTFADPYGLPNLLFAQIYPVSGDRWIQTGILPAWSVCVEASFYLLLPLYAAVTARANPWLPLVAITMLGFAYRLAMTQAGVAKHYLDLLPGTLPWFAIGMALAIVSVQGGSPRLLRDYRVCWTAALLTLYVTTLVTTESRDTGGVPLFLSYGLIAFLVVSPAVFASSVSVVTRPGIAWLGLVSYGVYLYHYPLMRAIDDRLNLYGTIGLLRLAIFGVVVAVASGAASYYVLERHALKLKRIRRASARPDRRGSAD